MRLTKKLMAAAIVLMLALTSFPISVSASDENIDILPLIESILGVPFEVDSTQHVFEMPDGRVIQWQFLDLLGHTLDIWDFTINESGNVFESERGDALIVDMDGAMFLYVDVGSSDEMGWGEGLRLYNTFELVEWDYDFLADAIYFIEMIEAVHPIFGVPDLLAEDYEDIRNELLETAAQVDNMTDAAFAMQRFVRVLQDGHMSIAGRQFFGNAFADIHWVFVDGSLFLLDDEGEVDAEVIEIGGISVADVFETIETYFFSENAIDRQLNYEIMARSRGIHRRAGIDVSDGTIAITIEYDGEPMEVYVDYRAGWHQINENTPDYNYIIRYEEMDDDIFFISLRMFQFDQPYHQQTIEAIENAIESGTRHFILDLRDNGGGNSMVGQELLEAMGITVPSFGVYRRISTLAQEQRSGEFISADTFEYWLENHYGEIIFESEPTTETAANPNDVVVAVLTNAFTYSSATMTSVWVQDGGFGVIIGEPSSNAPSPFGDMLTFRLPHSHALVAVSYSWFVRPDVEADQNTLWPDIPVRQDLALEAALEFFASR